VSLVLSRLDYGNATLVGIPMYQLKRLQSVLNAAARLVFSSRRRDHVSPLLRQLHWLQNGSSISSPFWFTSASTEWRRCIWQMSFSSRQTAPPGHGFVRHRHCSFAVHGCRRSATERFRSLLPVFGTVCRIMSPLLHRCLSTVAA